VSYELDHILKPRTQDKNKIYQELKFKRNFIL